MLSQIQVNEGTSLRQVVQKEMGVVGKESGCFFVGEMQKWEVTWERNKNGLRNRNWYLFEGARELMWALAG